MCVRERERATNMEKNENKKNQSQNLGQVNNNVKKEMIKDKRASMLSNKRRTNKMTSLAN